jgi:hypothetical protein
MSHETETVLAVAIPHLSASSVSDYLACPLLWYGRRIAKWPEPASAAMAIGTAVHAALAAFHQGEDAELALLEAWKKVRPEGPIAGSLERAIAALALYMDRTVPDVIYDKCESFVKCHIPEVPIPFIGYVDLLTPNNEIHEWKTGAARWWTQDRVDTGIQPTSYWWAFLQETGAPPARIVLHAMNTARQPVTITRYETQRTPAQLDGFIATVQDVYRHMLAQDLAATCAKGRCRFPEQCGAWQQEHGGAQ